MGAHSAENAEVRGVRVPDERLDELAVLAEKAQPGPWTTDDEGDRIRVHAADLVCEIVAYDQGSEADAEFIAAAGTDLAALVADLRAARADIERLREALTGLLDDLPAVRNAAKWQAMESIRAARAALAEEPRA